MEPSGSSRQTEERLMRSVIKPDGSVHMEQDLGCTRLDLTTGEASTVLGSGAGPHLVIGPDGHAATEWQSGAMRLTIGQPGFDTILGSRQ